MTFHDFVGHDDAKLALILNALDPRCGGVLFAGEKGCGKSTLARLFSGLVRRGTPFVNVPLNATEEALLGGIDMEETLRKGKKVREPGLLSRAGGGVLYIDDVNLLPAEITALLFKCQDSGKGSPPFAVMASMNPEEGDLSSHFLDRFGMCVLWEGLREKDQKIAVMKRAILSGDGKGRIPVSDAGEGLREKIDAARRVLDRLIVPPEVQEYLTNACIENSFSGHRGDIFLFYAARACAAFRGVREVAVEHVDEVLPLVLTHRKRLRQQMETDPQEDPQRHEKPQEQKEAPETDPPPSQSSKSQEARGDENNNNQDEKDERPRESRPREDISPVGEPFKVRRLAFRKDRKNRSLSGRRSKTGSQGRGGRYVKSLLRPNGDIAVDATIRTAAPHQAARGRKDRLLIHDEDFRFKQREKRIGHLVIFVVDGSGSMGAQKRMVETKGAIQSLLIDCYQKRDRVSLIVFRKDRAEVLLPPTSSVEAAARRLREIPVGGKTPLGAGLLETFQLIRRTALRSPQTRFLVVLVTDGRANQGLSEIPVSEEIQKMTVLLRDLKFTDYIVVDTEDKRTFTRTDRALQIASGLEAEYYTIDHLKADHLTGIVQRKKAHGEVIG